METQAQRMGESQGLTHRQTNRQTDRHTRTDTHTDTHTHTHAHTDTHTDTHTHAQTGLDKASEEYSRLHGEQQEITTLWENVIAQMERRDDEITTEAEAFAKLRETIAEHVSTCPLCLCVCVCKCVALLLPRFPCFLHSSLPCLATHPSFLFPRPLVPSPLLTTNPLPLVPLPLPHLHWARG